MMSVAWEWRVFRPTDQTPLFRLIEELTSPGDAPPSIFYEEDHYLLLPGCPHNMKLRSGSLEVKWRVEQRPGGYALWADKEVWPFPLGPAAMGALAATARRRCTHSADLHSPAELVVWLRGLITNVAVIPVQKERVRFHIGEARLELASLKLPGGGNWSSICVDGYDLAAVREVVRRGRLQTWGRTRSYVDMLQEAAWWLAASGQCDMGADTDAPQSLLRDLVGK